MLWSHFKSWSSKAKWWWMCKKNSSLKPWKRNVDSNTSSHILHLNGLWMFKVSNGQDKLVKGIQVLIYQRPHHTSLTCVAHWCSKHQFVTETNGLDKFVRRIQVLILHIWLISKMTEYHTQKKLWNGIFHSPYRWVISRLP